MAGVYGTSLYGKVDRVPGLFFVATQFFHINFVPLFPTGTYLVFDGTEADEGFRGEKLSLSGKSILLGYFRGWVGGAAAILSGAAGAFAATVLTGDDKGTPATIGFILALILGFVLGLYAVRSAGRFWVLAWGSLLVATGAYLAWDYSQPAAVKGKERDTVPVLLALAHGCLAAVSLTRVFDTAGHDRAHELGAELGLKEELIDAALAGDPVHVIVPTEEDDEEEKPVRRRKRPPDDAPAE